MFKIFRNLFRQQEPEPVPAAVAVETAPLSQEQLQSVSQQSVKMVPPQLMVGTAQSVGMQRDHNEDTLYAMQAMLADGSNDLAFGLFIVADGMGGHLNGEVASGVAVRTLSEFILSRMYTPYLIGRTGSEGGTIQELMEDAVREAHRSVLRSAPGGGTTLTAAVLIGDQLTVSHVGDSRAYFLYPDGRIEAITQDHSLVRRLQDLGQIDEKEASVHPNRNVLYRALGQSEPFRPDINSHILPAPGAMLICSDGLWGSVSDDDIARIIQAAPNPSAACHALIESANANGGPDNISAILVQYMA